MADRLYMKDNPPRLITSKPGFNASPNLDNANKTFDSEWFNGCAIKWRLNMHIPSNTTGTFLPFPYQLSYIPMIGYVNTEVYNSVPSGLFFAGIPWPITPTGPGMITSGTSTGSIFNVSNSGVTYVFAATPGDATYQIIVYEA